MLSREVLRQLRRLHLRAKKAVEDPLGGAYRSVFKGTGIAFEEVREYQPGDDIRSIDWNITARMGHPFVKRFIEERELTMMLVIDTSTSLDFSTALPRMRDVLAEVGALLTLCAVSNGDKVGALFASDRIELFLQPRKGTRHALRLIRDLFVHRPTSPGTNLRLALEKTQKLLHRRTLIFVFSDFLDEGYEKALERLSFRHDVIAVRLHDPRLAEFPSIGLVEIEDLETGKTLVVDTSDAKFQSAFRQNHDRHDQRFQQFARSGRIDVLDVDTQGRHLDALVRFFHRRQRERKS